VSQSKYAGWLIAVESCQTESCQTRHELVCGVDALFTVVYCVVFEDAVAVLSAYEQAVAELLFMDVAQVMLGEAMLAT